ncbi:MAG: trans-sulfuration enzyme family protein [Vulcanimicrobiaceae bacterium]
MKDSAYGAIAAPLYLSTTFERAADGSYPLGYEYSRDDNPNRRELETALAALEGGQDAAAFASGSAAAMTLFQALRPGDQVVVSDDCYFGVRQMLDQLFVPWGLAVRYVDTSIPGELAKAVRSGTRLIFIETPSNPQLKISDIREVARIAKDAGAILACDNTAATPILQRPLDLGADISIHSTTKYMSGHHDAMGGALVSRRTDNFWNSIRFAQKHCGCIPSPFACWLTLRALPSLRHRVRAQSDSALRLAKELSGHRLVERVLHPGLPSHPGYDVARAQMTGTGALFSILVAGGADRAMRVAANVRVFKRATSFGGPESLIEHRASIEAPGTKTPPNLLRLAIGLERTEDLIEDLDRALTA